MRAEVRGSVLLLCVSALTLWAGGVSSPADGSAHATRIVDRTLRCTTGVQGGVPVILVNARSAYGDGGQLDWFAQAFIAAAGQAVPTRPGFQPTLAGLTAGWPPPGGFRSGAVSFHNRRCAATRERVGFSRRGLVGGPAAQLGDEYQCRVPRAMLVRVRAEFTKPVALNLRDGRTYYTADGRITQGQIAVQTLQRRPILYADVVDSGRARVFTTGSCS